jgi:hypothetical protein
MNAYRKPSEQQLEEQQAAEDSEQEDEEAAHDSGSQADDEQEAEDQQATQQQQQQQQGSYAAAAADRAAARGKAAADAAAAAAAARGRQAAASSSSSSSGKQRQIGLSAADEQLIQQPFIPRASQGPLPEHAIISEALAPNRAYQQQVMSSPTRFQQQQQQQECEEEDDQHDEASADADCYHSIDGYQSTVHTGSSSRGGASSPFKTTIAKPFEFEAAAAVRPKSIAAVKLEQDLILKAQEEEAHYRQRWATLQSCV